MGILTLAAVKGDPPISLNVLFLARRDVEFGRKGLWRVRPSIAVSLNEPLAHMLTRGRTGTVDTPSLVNEVKRAGFWRR